MGELEGDYWGFGGGREKLVSRRMARKCGYRKYKARILHCMEPQLYISIRNSVLCIPCVLEFSKNLQAVFDLYI